jgi:hypothetical protein
MTEQIFLFPNYRSNFGSEIQIPFEKLTSFTSTFKNRKKNITNFKLMQVAGLIIKKNQVPVRFD